MDSGLIVGIGGIVLTVVLVALDKAGKLKGPVLIGLIVLAGAMTLPLALKNPYITNIAGPWKWWAQACAVTIICFIFWGIGIWISPEPQIQPPPTEQKTDSKKVGSLGLLATTSNAEYPVGTTLGGIPWSLRFVELRVNIQNPSAFDYEDVDLKLRPDEPVAGIGQITGLPDVFFTADADTTMRQELVEGATGRRLVNPLVLIASDGGYRIRCKLLPPQSRLEILFAIARPREFPKAPVQPKPNGGVFEADYVLKLSMSDGTGHWFGHGSVAGKRIESAFSETKHVPKSVRVEGSYRIGSEIKIVSEVLAARDFVADAMGKTIPRR